MRILPWWRRLWAWVGDFHKFVSALLGIAAATIAAHVWIQGLVTRGEVHAEVKRALTETLLDVRTEVETLKDRTGGLPTWRPRVDERLTQTETQAGHAEKLGQKANDRIDQYIDRRGGH